MKRFSLYLNSVIVKDAERRSTIEKYYRVYCKMYCPDENCISVYDRAEGRFVLDNHDDINK